MTDTLLSVLQCPFTFEEAQTIEGLVGQIEDSRKRVESGDFPDWQKRLEKVALLRIGASNTLRRGDNASWVQANIFVEEQVRNRQLPNWSAICQINSILTGKVSNQVVREQPIFLGRTEASRPEQLEAHIQFFTEQILPFETQNQHPLIAAAVLQYWIVSIHPFWDANGRTAVLVADWINLYFNYFPQGFELQVDGMIGHFANRASPGTPARAVFKVLKNNLSSYKAFLSS